MKFKQWLDVWLEDFVRPSMKSRTYKRYLVAVRTHIARILGDEELQELSAIKLQNFVAALTTRERTLSPGTVNNIISVMQGALKRAYLLGVIDEYIGDKIVRPRAEERRVQCFTQAEQRRIEAAAKRKDRLTGVLLCLYSGLRIGELIALKWSDIDFKRGLLDVSKSCHDAKGGVVFESPKSASSVRVIPLPKQIMPLLKEVKRRSNCEFVVSGCGRHISVRSYQRTFALLLKRLNIPHKGFHSLRHTFATRALECGMDVKTLSEILGHKNPTITLNRYAHSMLEHKRAMMNKVGKMLEK